MKQLFFLVLMAVAVGCSKKGTTTAPVNEVIPPTESSDVIAEGSFINGVHATSGTVKIVLDAGAHKLAMENFKTDAGPDLKVYLANDLNASLFITLGDLKSTNGNIVYTIADKPDYNNYKYVLIWCEQFAVLFGSAELK